MSIRSKEDAKALQFAVYDTPKVAPELKVLRRDGSTLTRTIWNGVYIGHFKRETGLLHGSELGKCYMSFSKIGYIDLWTRGPKGTGKAGRLFLGQFACKHVPMAVYQYSNPLRKKYQVVFRPGKTSVILYQLAEERAVSRRSIVKAA